MTVSVPLHIRRTILKPVRESHVAVCQIDCIRSAVLGRHRILLGQNQTHDLTQLHVVYEEVHMNRVRRKLGRSVGLVLEKVLLRDHLYV